MTFDDGRAASDSKPRGRLVYRCENCGERGIDGGHVRCPECGSDDLHAYRVPPKEPSR